MTFNTVITKLKEGRQIFSNTLMQPDLEAAKKACEGQDFIWIEMQHSRLTWRETEDLIRVIVQAGCIPFVRVPNANKGDIQKATDAGALGIIIPMVDTVEEARNAVMYAKWPIGSRDNPNTKPWGHRSSGGGQFTQLWGPAYQSNANNNILIMIQIENPQGVGAIDTILEEVPGIDIVMVASNDFGWQAGDRDGDESYNAREKIVREAVLEARQDTLRPIELAEPSWIPAVPGPPQCHQHGLRHHRQPDRVSGGQSSPSENSVSTSARRTSSDMAWCALSGSPSRMATRTAR